MNTSTEERMPYGVPGAPVQAEQRLKTSIATPQSQRGPEVSIMAIAVGEYFTDTDSDEEMDKIPSF